jgi:hypothetical protein
LLKTESMVGDVCDLGAGLFYWWLAARRFLPKRGLASAAISAMMLLGTIACSG